jgi:hypothetical protein
MELIVGYHSMYPTETKCHFAMKIVDEMDRRSRLEHVRESKSPRHSTIESHHSP